MKTCLLTLLIAFSVLLFYITFPSLNLNYKISSGNPLTIVKERKPTFTNPWMVLSNYEIFVFSAFWDLRIAQNPIIRILMFRNHGKQHSAECVVELQNETSIVLPGQFIPTDSEIHNERPYWSNYFVCQITPDLKSEPYAVALKMGSITSPYLELKKVKDSNEKPYFLTVCTKPLFNFNDWFRLVVYVEHYLTIGADRIVFYNHSITDEVEKVLQLYKKSGKIQVIQMPRVPHPLPMPNYVTVMEEKWYGQPIQIPDCIFRSIGSSKFWTDVDLDEFIGDPAGTKPNFLHELLADIIPQTGGIHIQSSFWNGHWPNNSIKSYELSGVESLPMFSPFQIGELYRHKVRSKLIVRPETVVRKSVHLVFEYLSGYTEMLMSPNKAVIYHLRKSDYVNAALTANPFQSLAPVLVEKVKKVVNELKNE